MIGLIRACIFGNSVTLAVVHLVLVLAQKQFCFNKPMMATKDATKQKKDSFPHSCNYQQEQISGLGHTEVLVCAGLSTPVARFQQWYS